MTVLNTPFRLGSTSYVWPDDILPNVRHLGPWVDDVELVLFEVDDYSNLPTAATVAELNALATDHQLTYTVHLPLNLTLAHVPSLEKAEKVIASTRDLSPWAYVVHLDGRDVEGTPGPERLAHWRDEALRALVQLADHVGDARQLCIENLENYSPAAFLPLLDHFPASLCVDVGHLWLTGQDPVPFLEEHMARTRIVHLHGIGTRDHESLLHQGAEQVAPLLQTFSAHNYAGVVTLEVFNREDFFSSRTLIAELMDGSHAK